MNPVELLKIVKSKERRDHILSLAKDKKYDDIYNYYGQTIYRLLAPKKFRKSDIKQLLDEHKYDVIYQKYGRSIYKDYIPEMYSRDVYMETGSKSKAFFTKLRYTLTHKLAPFLLSTSIALPPALGTTFHYLSTDTIEKNSIIYAEKIEEYNNKIENYANDIKSLNLTDFQTIMKVMSDMWDNIQGYGEPALDISGFYRLDFLEDNQTGVCRHMADDVTAKLNAINPEYHARNLYVYLDTNQYFHVANIPRTIINSNETVTDNDTASSSNASSEFVLKAMGNHAVTVMDLPNENISLVIDPTNPGIGVFKNGQIHMFSTDNGKGISTRQIISVVFFGASPTDMLSDYFKSFLESDKSLEELKELYGTEAQNATLDELKKLEQTEKQTTEQLVDHSEDQTTEQTLEQFLKPLKSKSTEQTTSVFDKRYKVDSDITLFPPKNVEDSPASTTYDSDLDR